MQNRYFTAVLTRKLLQLGTDLLGIITSTADQLSGGTDIDDLQLSETPE